ncbi:MAG TPA: TIGR04282 family arsenosugar biosynthesis glycosyltransferase [Solirubrobacterales bacterium]|nr:TIGR04282 family arsenosugar biosynthesis glycosyltransferase [Solirubrobacterales bacterium]
MSARLVVIAKSPEPGRSKTRLSPPCEPAQAARLAEAALRDTLAAVAATRCRERVLALAGPPGDWLPAGFTVVDQGTGSLDRRLGHVFSRCVGPTLLIGMDTPQVDPLLLEEAIASLEAPGTDAVLGHAEDGGYWAIGLRRPDPRAFAGVPMSVADTGARQEAALRGLGLRVGLLPTLRDVDLIGDARAVAAMAPAGNFARTVEQVEEELCVR